MEDEPPNGAGSAQPDEDSGATMDGISLDSMPEIFRSDSPVHVNETLQSSTVSLVSACQDWRETW